MRHGCYTMLEFLLELREDGEIRKWKHSHVPPNVLHPQQKIKKAKTKKQKNSKSPLPMSFDRLTKNCCVIQNLKNSTNKSMSMSFPQHAL